MAAPLAIKASHALSVAVYHGVPAPLVSCGETPFRRHLLVA